ncbi:MAG: biotin synthase BioB [Acidimicrobiales bacterium]|nr:biotin synthase BioB [Acidimicrobiales bacterium]
MADKKDYSEFIESIRSKIIDDGLTLNEEELLQLAHFPTSKTQLIIELAHEVRLKCCGEDVDIEGIVSAKTGACPENCAFCSQSASAQSSVYPTSFLPADEILKAAKEAESYGATSFCLVYALRGPDERAMNHIISMVDLVQSNTSLQVNVSAGLLTKDNAERLKEAGVLRYNHNLETAKSHFQAIASTHSYQERWDTCKAVLDAGLKLCCGAILGVGETIEQRVELLRDLQLLDPTEVPINFLNPRPGTQLEDSKRLDAQEAIKWVGIFRLALPKTILRFGGGREITLGDLQSVGMTSGANGLIIGNYLTTLGRSPEEDLEMLKELEMPVSVVSNIL